MWVPPGSYAVDGQSSTRLVRTGRPLRLASTELRYRLFFPETLRKSGFRQLRQKLLKTRFSAIADI
jgi:hypothetical protein